MAARSEALFGLRRGELRKFIDRKRMSEQLVVAIESVVFNAMRRHAADLRDEAIAAAKGYEAFATLCGAIGETREPPRSGPRPLGSEGRLPASGPD